MLRIGLTGGIGSGKSTAAKIFELLGIPVYYADEAARRLMNENEELKEKIREVFGNEAYENGALNRKYISAVAFKDPGKLEKLNLLVHPLTLEDAASWMQSRAAAYAIKEAALIFESGAHEFLDKVIGVYAPAPLRIQRVMQRDNISREAVLARMDKQLDEEMKMKLCDFILTNDEQHLLIPQVLALHETLLKLASEKQKM